MIDRFNQIWLDSPLPTDRIQGFKGPGLGPRCLRTSIFTMCWTGGSSGWCVPAAGGRRSWSAWRLGQLARRVADDGECRYAFRPVLLETFVERDRFRGTSYQAANWVLRAIPRAGASLTATNGMTNRCRRSSSTRWRATSGKSWQKILKASPNNYECQHETRCSYRYFRKSSTLHRACSSMFSTTLRFNDYPLWTGTVTLREGSCGKARR
jgi:hypothetical protein